MDAKKCYSVGLILSVYIKVVLLVKMKILRNFFLNFDKITPGVFWQLYIYQFPKTIRKRNSTIEK